MKSSDRDSLHTISNDYFGSIPVKERSCAALISKVECYISDGFCVTLWCSVNRALVDPFWRKDG